MRIHVIASPPKMADSLLLGEMTSPRKRDIDSDKALWVNCLKEKCVSADLMHLFLVRFVTVRLTYIFIDYPDCEYIIILNTSIVRYDFWRLSVLLSSTPSMPIFGNCHRQKACLLTNKMNDTHAHIYHQYDTYVAEFHKKRKMYTSTVADK